MRVLLFLQRFSCCILYQNGLFESRWNNAWKSFVRKFERPILTLCKRENGLARRRKEPYHEQDQIHRAASCDLASQGSSLRSSGNPTPSARVHFICGCRNRRRSYGVPAERSEGRATHRERGDSRAKRVPSDDNRNRPQSLRPLRQNPPTTPSAFAKASAAAKALADKPADKPNHQTTKPHPRRNRAHKARRK